MMSPKFSIATDEDDIFADLSPTSLNRYSMPVTRNRTGFYDFSSLDQTNTTRFLFGEEEEHAANGETNKLYHQTANANVTGLDESFPTLTRSEGQNNMVRLFPFFQFLVLVFFSFLFSHFMSFNLFLLPLLANSAIGSCWEKVRIF